MIEDPHKVLGVEKGATQDEIKRAYRRKAKEYHPDLHPNDPNAARKMNEINQAYDMLMNPDKYAQQRARQQAQQQAQQNYGSPYGQGYGGYGGQQQGYQGQGGWYSDFGGFGFGFEDFFGGGSYGGSVQPPQEQPGDSPQIRQVIQDIRSGHYQNAVTRLQSIVSTGRNARWYYLSGVANHGAGNTILATEHMQRAVQMDPNNQVYHALLRQYRAAGQAYQHNARGFDMGAMDPSKLCLGLCLAQMCCRYGFCCI